MKKALGGVMIVALGVCLFLGAGCTKKAASSSEAITFSESLKTVQEKTDYLMKQAEAFYNSKEFQKAVETAQYVLSNLDSQSQSAKDLIEKAKNQLQASAQKAVGDMTNKLLGK